VSARPIWSIDVIRGEAPFALSPPSRQPAISAAMFPEVDARFVADPFMLWTAGRWHLFMEVLSGATGRGEIGYATSADGASWTAHGTVLREPFHLSYPSVVQWDGQVWMIPETLGARAIRLYRAERFPDRWAFAHDLLPLYGADPSVFHHGNRWWMFVCTTPHAHDTLALYSADDLRGPWSEHPLSPIVTGDRRIARPAGRPRNIGGRLYRFAQDCAECYGRQVRAFEILELTPESYREREIEESPIFGASGNGWNRDGMHHFDPHPLPGGGWIASVDGHALS